MINIAEYKPIVCSQLAFVTTADKQALVNGAQKLSLRCDQDVYVDFDQPTSTSQSYLILAANTADTVIELPGGSIQNVHAKGKTQSGTLYIIAMVN